MDNMSQFLDPAAMAQLYAEQQRLQQRQQLAQSLMSTGYIPNSGNAGLLAGVASMLRGKFMQNEDEGKVSDLLRRQFEAQNKAAIAERQQKLADEDRKMRNDLTLASGKSRAEAAAKKEFAIPQFQGGGVFDPTTGAWTASPDFAKQQIGIKAGEAEAAARASAKYREAPGATEMAKLAMAQKLGATPEQLLSMVTGQGASHDTQIVGGNVVDKRTGKAIPITGPDGSPIHMNTPLSAEARTKLSLIDNALANAQKYQERVTQGQDKGGFNDWASRMNDTPQLIKSAVQDMLYAKSGASAPEAEVEKAYSMYSPSTFLGIPTEKDSTSAAKVGNLITDLERMRAQIAGEGGQAAPQGQPEAQTKILNGKTYINIGGQWYEQ